MLNGNCDKYEAQGIIEPQMSLDTSLNIKIITN